MVCHVRNLQGSVYNGRSVSADRRELPMPYISPGINHVVDNGRSIR